MRIDNHEFVLILPGVADSTTYIEAALYQSGCDDATIDVRGGVVRLQFIRAAPSFEFALASAIREVKRAGFTPASEE